MSSIQPIATSRVTDAMSRGRLTAQIQSDQLALFRLQNQISTGFRIFLPSDDVSSAQRAMVLQRTIERKDQAATNLQGTLAALSSSDRPLSELSGELNSLKANALQVISTISSDEERASVVRQIDNLLSNLSQVGNSSFTGSYLFGGTEVTSPPFNETGLYVEYEGDESSPQTFVDIGYLFDTLTPGDDIFGGLSESVRGSVDLDAQLTSDTRLAQINGGNGVSPNGAIEIIFDPTNLSDPTTSAVIDVSSAETVGDIARLIENNAPAGADITVTITGQGLTVATANGGVTIGEVAEGSSARELGLLTTGAPSDSVTGGSLDPTLRQTTALSDLTGTKARGLMNLGGVNNNISLVADANGSGFNNLTVNVVDGATVGSETAAYDSGTNTLTLTVAAGQSDANQVTAAINAEGTFVAETDYRDATSAANQGTGKVPVTTLTGVTSSGSGGSIDLASGLRVTNGEEVYTIDTSSAQTVQDMLNLLNNPEYGLRATINESGNGIDVRTRRSGADFTIGENGGSTAEDLGIRTYTTDSRLDDFNRGLGVLAEGSTPVETASLNRFSLTVDVGGTPTTYDVDLTNATTVDDLINAINTATSGEVTASLATVGNGLVLTDTTGGGTGIADSITLTGAAAERLGFFAEGEDSATLTIAGGSLASEDRNTLEVDSVFTTLIRMRDALKAGDEIALGNEMGRLDRDLNRVNFGRAEIGARVQNLNTIKDRLADEKVDLQSALSTEIDVDFAEAVSDFVQKQASLEASLQVASSLLSLSILDFI